MQRLFKNKIFLLVIATVLILVVIGVSSRGNSKLNWLNNIINVPLAPVEKGISVITSKVEDGMSYFKSKKQLDDENKTLKAKIEELEKKITRMDYLESQNKEMRDMLDIKDIYRNYSIIGGNVIAKDAGNWFDVFTIDVGQNKGISSSGEDSFSGYYPVITSKGLVGRIITVSAFSSKVRTIIDEDSTVSCIVTKNRQYVDVKGSMEYKDQGLCIVENIDTNTDLSPGDTIETSGAGDGYPKGIIVGKIIEVKKNQDDLKTYAILKPAVDFKSLETVFVLKSNTDNGDTGSVE